MELLDALVRCYPFHQIDQLEVTPLLSGLHIETYRRGQTLLRGAKQAGPVRQLDSFSYLLGGRAELRRSFFDKETLQAGEGPALQPLDYLLMSEGGQILALDECRLVQVPRDVIDRSMATDSARDYGVHETDLNTEVLESDDAVPADWMSRFLSLPLAQHLPAMVIQQLLTCIVTEDKARGVDVVRRGAAGDALYVITRGRALVQTDRHGIFQGREISLLPGDYFGEESLVADTPRNATVVMEEDGSVARLDRSDFDRLVRPYLVPGADDALMERALVASSDSRLVVIDVRFPMEYRRDALPHSINIPVPLLRSRLNLLDRRRQHLVTYHGGRRSELAVFLLRQAGIEAYLMASSAHRFAQVSTAKGY
jgi:rhodanese-related sulfurtransferase